MAKSSAVPELDDVAAVILGAKITMRLLPMVIAQGLPWRVSISSIGSTVCHRSDQTTGKLRAPV
jgi:hypothetical protein